MKNTVTAALVFAGLALGTGSVVAADMPLKAPPAAAPPPQAFSWTGIYLGTEVGYGESHTDSVRVVANNSFPVGFSDTTNFHGALGGVDLGANYQWNWLVLGVEGDWQGSMISGTAQVFSPIFAGRFTDQSRETNWISTVTGRIGLAWDHWLVYGKGGGAWRRINESASNVTFSPAGVVLSNATVNAATESGYVVGGGVEWAASDLVSVKLEYDWYNFGTQASSGGVCLAGGCGGPGAIIASGESSSQPRLWEIKGGVNLHFNWLASAR